MFKAGDAEDFCSCVVDVAGLIGGVQMRCRWQRRMFSKSENALKVQDDGIIGSSG